MFAQRFALVHLITLRLLAGLIPTRRPTLPSCVACVTSGRACCG